MKLFILSLDEDAYNWIEKDIGKGVIYSFIGLLEVF